MAGEEAGKKRRLTAEEVSAGEFTFREEEVEIPQLGGTVLLREMPIGKRDKLLNEALNSDEKVDWGESRVRTFTAYCVDPVFKRADVRRFLPKWPSSVVDHVFWVINNKLGGQDIDEEDSATVAEEFQEPE